MNIILNNCNIPAQARWCSLPTVALYFYQEILPDTSNLNVRTKTSHPASQPHKSYCIRIVSLGDRKDPQVDKTASEVSAVLLRKQHGIETSVFLSQTQPRLTSAVQERVCCCQEIPAGGKNLRKKKTKKRKRPPMCRIPGVELWGSRFVIAVQWVRSLAYYLRWLLAFAGRGLGDVARDHGAKDIPVGPQHCTQQKCT